METRRTKDEFIYDSCKKFLETNGEPEVIWALVDGKFRIYAVETAELPAPSPDFMPRRAQVLVEQYLGDTAELCKNIYEGWSAEDFCALGKQHYDILVAQGQFDHKQAKNVLVTPTDFRLLVTYEAKTMAFMIPDHLREELMDWQYILDPPTSNVYHLRHNA